MGFTMAGNVLIWDLQTKILVLDEGSIISVSLEWTSWSYFLIATSAVDLDTDRAIQDIIRGPQFAEVTMLTIASVIATAFPLCAKFWPWMWTGIDLILSWSQTAYSFLKPEGYVCLSSPVGTADRAPCRWLSLTRQKVCWLLSQARFIRLHRKLA